VADLSNITKIFKFCHFIIYVISILICKLQLITCNKRDYKNVIYIYIYIYIYICFNVLVFYPKISSNLQVEKRIQTPQNFERKLSDLIIIKFLSFSNIISVPKN
jgi:hypothetical protein